MKRKFLSVLLAGALAVSMLAGCGGGNDAAETTTETTDTAETDTAETDTADADAAETDDSAGGGLVGVSMPTQDLQRWNQDGSNMKAELEAAGYTVELQYASNDIATQVSQIETMITNGCELLVIASIDGDSLGTVLAQAKEQGIPVIAYDRLIMNSDAVSYYATFDNYLVGQTQGQYIVDALDLSKAAGRIVESRRIELHRAAGRNLKKLHLSGVIGKIIRDVLLASHHQDRALICHIDLRAAVILDGIQRIVMSVAVADLNGQASKYTVLDGFQFRAGLQLRFGCHIDYPLCHRRLSQALQQIRDFDVQNPSVFPEFRICHLFHGFSSSFSPLKLSRFRDNRTRRPGPDL